MRQLGVKSKLLLSIGVLNLVLGGCVYWYVNRLSEQQAVAAAVDAARNRLRFASALRDYYTRHVVGNALVKNVEVSHDYAQKKGAIPLPATMAHELNDEVNKADGYILRLYSNYPFPNRRDGGPRDGFEEEALRSLGADPEADYWRREDYKGKPAVRFAVADVMTSKSCVDCHNSHPNSPKTGWKLGDVRGALEVIVPLDAGLAASQAGARRIALAFGAGMAILLALITFISGRFIFTPLHKLARAAKGIARGEMNQRIDHESSDEIGVLSQSFRDMQHSLEGLIHETTGLTAAAKAGQLSPARRAGALQRRLPRPRAGHERDARRHAHPHPGSDARASSASPRATSPRA